MLGRMYTDEQLFRIIVPKRFTLRAHLPTNQVKAGFSEQAITTSGDIKPDFTDEDITLVLQYRWPETFGDLKACDLDAVNNSVRGVGNNLNPETDILSYDDVTLSSYCHEKLYDDKARREQILCCFEAELHEARELRRVAVEERFERTDPGVLHYIVISKVYHALSWDSIANSLNRRHRRPAGLIGHVNEFDAGLVEEIFQLHADAKTTIFETCVSRDWRKLSSSMAPTGRLKREAHSPGRFSPVTPGAMTLAESQEEN